MSTLAVLARVTYLFLIWLWLPQALLRTSRHVIGTVTWWVAGATLGASGALIQLQFGDVIPGGAVTYGRFTGFTTHFNTLGALASTRVHTRSLLSSYFRVAEKIAARATPG